RRLCTRRSCARTALLSQPATARSEQRSRRQPAGKRRQTMQATICCVTFDHVPGHRLPFTPLARARFRAYGSEQAGGTMKTLKTALAILAVLAVTAGIHVSAAADEKKAEGVLQVHVTIPPTPSPNAEYDVGDRFTAIMSDTFRGLGYDGDIEWI